MMCSEFVLAALLRISRDCQEKWTVNQNKRLTVAGSVVVLEVMIFLICCKDLGNRICC